MAGHSAATGLLEKQAQGGRGGEYWGRGGKLRTTELRRVRARETRVEIEMVQVEQDRSAVPAYQVVHLVDGLEGRQQQGGARQRGGQ